MLTIRLAKAEEQTLLLELQRRASLMWEEDRQWLLQNPEAIQLPLQFIENGHVYVAESANQIKGFAVLLPRENEVEIDGLFVDPGHWRQGIGSALINHLKKKAWEDHVEFLGVLSNLRSYDFYVANNFQKIQDVPTETGRGVLMICEVYRPLESDEHAQALSNIEEPNLTIKPTREVIPYKEFVAATFLNNWDHVPAYLVSEIDHREVREVYAEYTGWIRNSVGKWCNTVFSEDQIAEQLSMFNFPFQPDWRACSQPIFDLLVKGEYSIHFDLFEPHISGHLQGSSGEMSELDMFCFMYWDNCGFRDYNTERELQFADHILTIWERCLCSQKAGLHECAIHGLGHTIFTSDPPIVNRAKAILNTYLGTQQNLHLRLITYAKDALRGHMQ